jgi:hypothetical protein
MHKGTDMKAKELFSQEELEAMGARTLDLLLASIEDGDKGSAKGFSQRMYNEFSAMHDLYRDWVTDLLTFIGRRFGDGVLHDALKQSVEGFTSALSKRYAGKSARRKMEILAAGLRGHLFPFRVEEDEEKFIIMPEVCGSGERLIREGAYDPPRSFLKIKRPQPMTFDREDFPVYCAHCYFQNMVPAEPGGSPLFVTEPSEELGKKPCRIYVYK